MKSVRSLLNHHCSRSRLSCYLDGQLSDRQAARVSEHLDECRICRNDLESLRATVALLRAMPAPCMPRSIVIPESAVAAQYQVRRVDTVFSALRVGAVVVTLMLAVLLSQEVIQAVRPAQLQTAAVEMVADSGPALEGAGGGPGVLREAPVERKAAEAEPVATAAAEQVVAAKGADAVSESTEASEPAPEALNLMAAPVSENTAPGEGSEAEGPASAAALAEEGAASALEAPLEAQAETEGSDTPTSPPQAEAAPGLSAAGEPALAKSLPAEQPKFWTASRVAAAILGTLLLTLVGALLWVGQRRLTL